MSRPSLQLQDEAKQREHATLVRDAVLDLTRGAATNRTSVAHVVRYVETLHTTELLADEVRLLLRGMKREVWARVQDLELPEPAVTPVQKQKQEPLRIPRSITMQIQIELDESGQKMRVVRAGTREHGVKLHIEEESWQLASNGQQHGTFTVELFGSAGGGK